MRQRKYDPVYHSCVVKNLKASFKAEFKIELTLTDEDVWNIFDEFSGVGATNEEGEAEVREQLYYKQFGSYPVTLDASESEASDG